MALLSGLTVGMIKQAMSEQERISHCTSCVNQYRSEMESLIDAVPTGGVEVGFLLCMSFEGEYLMGRKCSGDACSLDLSDCHGMVEIGSFHVHPPGYPVEPSLMDMATCFKENIAFIAIGGEAEGVRCFYPYETEEFHEFLKVFDETDAIERRYGPTLVALAKSVFKGMLPISDATSKTLADFISGEYTIENYSVIVDTLDEASRGETAWDYYIQRSLKKINTQELFAFSIKRKLASAMFYNNTDAMYKEVVL